MRAVLALATALFTAPVVADTPLRPPEVRTVCSVSGSVCVVSDPDSRVTTVNLAELQKESWTLPGWHRSLYVSDDGESVVVGYPGLNLLPVSATLQEPVLFFHARSGLVRKVLLGDLYESKSQLTPTVSHYAWGSILGINASNQLVVERVDGTTLAFSVRTGDVEPIVNDVP